MAKSAFKLENSVAQNRIAANKAEEPMLADARRIDISKIVPNPLQVRQNFDTDDARESLLQLAADIEERGILQPLVVRQIESGKYEIVAGERRYRAAKEIGLSWLPVILREMTDEEAHMTSLVENVQRKDLDVADEAHFLAALKHEYSLSDSEIARRIHKSQPYVAKRLKLAYHPDLLDKIRQGKATINSAYDEATSRQSAKALADGRTKVGKAGKRDTQNLIEQGDELERRLFLRNKLIHIPFMRLKEAIAKIEQQWETITSDEREGLLAELANIEAHIVDLRQRLEPEQIIPTYTNEHEPFAITQDEIELDDVGENDSEDEDFGFLPTPSRSTVRKR